MTDSLIRKEDAIKALGEEPMVWTDSDFELADRNRWEMDVEAIKKLQPVPQDEMTYEQFKEYCRKRCLSVVTNELVEEVHRMNEMRRPETCEGCRHLGKWENEVECGYPSPCTRCKRRAEDRYER